MTNIKTIPKKLEDIFERIESEVNLLHGYWITYGELFGTSKERVNLLNECAAWFSYVTQNILTDVIQLTLTKLADPVMTFGKKKNISLELICEIVKELEEEELLANLEECLSRYREKCEIFKRHRDKRIAHFDYSTHIDKKGEPLPGISRAMIEDALKELRCFMNKVKGFFTDVEAGYEYIKMVSGGDALIEMLKRGLRYDELLKERKIDFMDMQKSKYYKV
jgi:hypothetical protein